MRGRFMQRWVKTLRPQRSQRLPGDSLLGLLDQQLPQTPLVFVVELQQQALLIELLETQFSFE